MAIITNKKATYWKEIGSDSTGAIKIKGKWVGYKCLYCARQKFPHLFIDRWQGPSSPSIEKAAKNPKILCEGKEYHSKIFQEKEMLKSSKNSIAKNNSIDSIINQIKSKIESKFNTNVCYLDKFEKKVINEIDVYIFYMKTPLYIHIVRLSGAIPSDEEENDFNIGINNKRSRAIPEVYGGKLTGTKKDINIIVRAIVNSLKKWMKKVGDSSYKYILKGSYINIIEKLKNKGRVDLAQKVIAIIVNDLNNILPVSKFVESGKWTKQKAIEFIKDLSKKALRESAIHQEEIMSVLEILHALVAETLDYKVRFQQKNNDSSVKNVLGRKELKTQENVKKLAKWISRETGYSISIRKSTSGSMRGYVTLSIKPWKRGKMYPEWSFEFSRKLAKEYVHSEPHPTFVNLHSFSYFIGSDIYNWKKRLT